MAEVAQINLGILQLNPNYELTEDDDVEEPDGSLIKERIVRLRNTVKTSKTPKTKSKRMSNVDIESDSSNNDEIVLVPNRRKTRSNNDFPINEVPIERNSKRSKRSDASLFYLKFRI